MQIEIVNTEATVYSGQAGFIRLPGKMGELGVLPGHIPLMTWLKPGTVYIKGEKGDEYVYVTGGLVEVMPHTVTILADTAVRTTGMDDERAAAARTQTASHLRDQLDEMRYAAARAELLLSLRGRGRDS